MVRVTARHDCTVVTVGDCKVGKSALVVKFRTGKFDTGYNKTNFETVSTSTIVKGKRVKFTIYDTSGSHGPNTSREIAYREADVFLLCYKISDPATLFSAINHWVPELRSHAPVTPIVLVGCQADLRGDRTVHAALAKIGRSPVSLEQAQSLAQQAGAITYCETSARLSTKSPETVFELCAAISLEQVATPISTSTPEQTLDRNGETFWSDGSAQSPPLPSRSSSLQGFHRTSSLSSSLNSTRSSISLPPNLPRSPRNNRRGSMSLRSKHPQDRMIKIKCQRLTQDKIYEEVEIEVPAPIYETLQACNDPGVVEKKKKESLSSKLKHLFIRD